MVFHLRLKPFQSQSFYGEYFMADEAQADIKAPVLIPPPVQIFELDDDNWVFTGEASFNLDDVKSIIRTVRQDNASVGVILFNFQGSQMGVQIASGEQRDEIFEEIRRRLRHLKANTFHIYIKEQKKAREKAAA